MTPKEARKILKILLKQDKQRSKNRSIVAGMYDGLPPYSKKLLNTFKR